MDFKYLIECDGLWDRNMALAEKN